MHLIYVPRYYQQSRLGERNISSPSAPAYSLACRFNGRQTRAPAVVLRPGNREPGSPTRAARVVSGRTRMTRGPWAIDDQGTHAGNSRRTSPVHLRGMGTSPVFSMGASAARHFEDAKFDAATGPGELTSVAASIPVWGVIGCN